MASQSRVSHWLPVWAPRERLELVLYAEHVTPDRDAASGRPVLWLLVEPNRPTQAWHVRAARLKQRRDKSRRDPTFPKVTPKVVRQFAAIAGATPERRRAMIASFARRFGGLDLPQPVPGGYERADGGGIVRGELEYDWHEESQALANALGSLQLAYQILVPARQPIIHATAGPSMRHPSLADSALLLAAKYQILREAQRQPPPPPTEKYKAGAERYNRNLMGGTEQDQIRHIVRRLREQIVAKVSGGLARQLELRLSGDSLPLAASPAWQELSLSPRLWLQVANMASEPLNARQVRDCACGCGRVIVTPIHGNIRQFDASCRTRVRRQRLTAQGLTQHGQPRIRRPYRARARKTDGDTA